MHVAVIGAGFLGARIITELLLLGSDVAAWLNRMVGGCRWGIRRKEELNG